MFLKEYGRYWSASCQMPHIGATARHKRIDETNELAQYICEELTKRGFFIEYDLSYPGPGNTLFITEMFASNGGIMIRTAHNEFNELMASNAKSKRRDVDDFVFEPKYTQMSLPLPKFDTLAILPGSNLLSEINLESLRILELNSGYIKPHPITNRADMRNLKRLFKGNVLRSEDNAIACIDQANVVLSTTSSELGLIAKLKGKEVLVFNKEQRACTYTHFYKEINRLDEVFGSAAGGLFLASEDYKEQLDEWLANWDRCNEIYHK